MKIALLVGYIFFCSFWNIGEYDCEEKNKSLMISFIET